MNSTTDQIVIACVAVRMNSTRLARKATADIHGQPLLRRLIDRLRTSKTIARIVVCTSTHPEDQILAESALEWGVESIRGDEADVLSRFISAAEEYSADVVVRVTGDNVLTDPSTIDALVGYQQETGADYVRANDLPLGISAEVMRTDMLRRLHCLMPDPGESEYMTLFAFDPAHFNCAVLDVPNSVKRPFYSLSVDREEDLALVRRLYAEYPESTTGPDLDEIVEFLDAHAEYKKLSDDTKIKYPNGVTRTYLEFRDWLNRRLDSTE